MGTSGPRELGRGAGSRLAGGDPHVRPAGWGGSRFGYLRLTHWAGSHILNDAPCSGAVRHGQAQPRHAARHVMAGQVGQANPVHLLAPYGGVSGGARPNYIVSAGANPHMTSSTQASPTPKVAVNDIG